MVKEHRIMFRGDQATIDIMEKLGSKLGIGRGELLRFCLENTAERFLDFEAALIVIERSRWTGIVEMLRKTMIEKVCENQRDLVTQFAKLKDEIIKKISENPKVIDFAKNIDKK